MLPTVEWVLQPAQLVVPGTARSSCRALARSVPRHELGHVEVFSRFIVRATATPRRPILSTRSSARPRLARTVAGLVEPGGHPSVCQPHVAQQALGVVAHRHRELSQVARELGSLAQDLAGGHVRLAHDLPRVLSRLRTDLFGLLLRVLTQPREIVAPGGTYPLALLAG